MASQGREEAGIGRYLAAQRRLRGISLEELAHATKIPSRSLERLEAGAFDAASDGFVRGFVRTVAEALGLDPDEAVMRLLEEPRAEPGPSGPAGAGLQWPALLLPAAVVAAGALAALLVWKLVSFFMSPASEPEVREMVLRRDPVRELAQEVQAGTYAPAAAELAAEAPAPTELGVEVPPPAAAELPPVTPHAPPSALPQVTPPAAPAEPPQVTPLAPPAALPQVTPPAGPAEPPQVTPPASRGDLQGGTEPASPGEAPATE